MCIRDSSLAHKTGAVFGIPHGCCNAILLPNVIQYNSKVCADRYACIARAIGLSGKSDNELVKALVDSIKDLNKKLDIKQSYREKDVYKRQDVYRLSRLRLFPRTNLNSFIFSKVFLSELNRFQHIRI